MCAGYWFLLTKVYHFTGRQATELRLICFERHSDSSCAAIGSTRHVDPGGKSGRSIRRSS